MKKRKHRNDVGGFRCSENESSGTVLELLEFRTETFRAAPPKGDQSLTVISIVSFSIKWNHTDACDLLVTTKSHSTITTLL